MIDTNTLLAVGSSIMSAVAVVATLKTDIRWVRETLAQHDKRIEKVEDRCAANHPCHQA